MRRWRCFVAPAHVCWLEHCSPYHSNREVTYENFCLERGRHALAWLEASQRDKVRVLPASSRVVVTNTTYGHALDFITRNGDLSKLGINPGDVVAYGCPQSASALAAMAFLSIASQATAAPLAPGSSEKETLDALDQFKATHLILFDQVDCPGVTAAFKRFAQAGHATLHYASSDDSNRPGLFKYTSNCQMASRFYPSPEESTCLLLRTSGTTSRPKGVPLQLGSLVKNGAILASSLGLTSNDVCYSVMPLFHIGGLAASVLCTVASGGALCCETEPYNSARMVEALAISNPRPTWYSAVPTIHNSTVNFIKSIAADGDPNYVAYGIQTNGVWKRANHAGEPGHCLRMIRSGAAALLESDAHALAKAYDNLPILPTYSMSEQMPISQPPTGKANMITDKPGSVGQPVSASIAIVDSSLRPVPKGEVGEIAICGPTVMKNYLDNPKADMSAYFYLTLGLAGTLPSEETSRYFLTGDTGLLNEEGFLTLKGRSKELIKRGGEQISPVRLFHLGSSCFLFGFSHNASSLLNYSLRWKKCSNSIP